MCAPFLIAYKINGHAAFSGAMIDENKIVLASNPQKIYYQYKPDCDYCLQRACV